MNLKLLENLLFLLGTVSHLYVTCICFAWEKKCQIISANAKQISVGINSFFELLVSTGANHKALLACVLQNQVGAIFRASFNTISTLHKNRIIIMNIPWKNVPLSFSLQMFMTLMFFFWWTTVIENNLTTSASSWQNSGLSSCVIICLCLGSMKW